jgi:hypothetical protein
MYAGVSSEVRRAIGQRRVLLGRGPPPRGRKVVAVSGMAGLHGCEHLVGVARRPRAANGGVEDVLRVAARWGRPLEVAPQARCVIVNGLGARCK